MRSYTYVRTQLLRVRARARYWRAVIVAAASIRINTVSDPPRKVIETYLHNRLSLLPGSTKSDVEMCTDKLIKEIGTRFLDARSIVDELFMRLKDDKPIMSKVNTLIILTKKCIKMHV